MRRIAFRALPALASAAVLFNAASPAVAGAAVKAHKASGAITVSAVEYKFKLSAASLAKPGSATFKVTNNGHVSHDFEINHKTSAMLSPGKSATLTVKFAKKGNYPYECTVPGHAALGMKGTFKVK
jgi:uncharacterized cupredoxin-like copper-binding protein